uniref:Uncharacterized protein n=1 Tax=Prevotella sp. GTC17262 TaxID=3236797 RepID=A0AB33JQ64_9BACT
MFLQRYVFYGNVRTIAWSKIFLIFVKEISSSSLAGKAHPETAPSLYIPPCTTHELKDSATQKTARPRQCYCPGFAAVLSGLCSDAAEALQQNDMDLTGSQKNPGYSARRIHSGYESGE